VLVQLSRFDSRDETVKSLLKELDEQDQSRRVKANPKSEIQNPK
jgi:hypothetical protein